jgi:two-component system, NarL family, nitrate/nitrite response regulator NarL
MSTTRLLICDDVDDIRLLMRVAFENENDFEVVGEATNGQEGIEAARQFKPDVVLLDINMPVKGGIEALPEIRAALPDAAIVIFSGFEEWSLGQEAKRCGADAYIEKGTDVGIIMDKVRKVIAERRAASGDGAASVG